MSFVWIPGTPVDQTALDRLIFHFPKPQLPPPEAWFMGDINYLNFIIDTDPDKLNIYHLSRYLEDTSGGLRIFPEVEFAIQAWKETFHYLFPRLMKRVHEDYLLAKLINYFLTIYPDSISDIYPEFQSDILSILGRVIMSSLFWTGEDLSERIQQDEHQYWISYATHDFLMILAPAIFFCLKYLKPQEVEEWTVSLIKIPGMHWHYNFLLCLYNATFILSVFEEDSKLTSIETISSSLIGVSNINLSPFTLPTENMKKFINILKKHHVYYG